MNFKKIFSTVLLLGVMAIPFTGVLAANNESCQLSSSVLNMMTSKGYTSCSTTCNFVSTPECGTCCLINTIYNVVDWAFIVIMAVAVGMIVWAAFLYMNSGGDATKLEGAKNKVLYAAVGIVVALLAKALPGIVLSVVG
ncbi:MAG: pilin [Candidatus Pacebacteria bacterium]|nr:pilin [Candidatus Paceibacterota bacterium]